MIKDVVVRDISGQVINIGEWQYFEKTVIDDVTGVSSNVITNPLPEGATQSEEDVIVNEDGSRLAANP